MGIQSPDLRNAAYALVQQTRTWQELDGVVRASLKKRVDTATELTRLRSTEDRLSRMAGTDYDALLQQSGDQVLEAAAAAHHRIFDVVRTWHGMDENKLAMWAYAIPEGGARSPGQEVVSSAEARRRLATVGAQLDALGATCRTVRAGLAGYVGARLGKAYGPGIIGMLTKAFAASDSILLVRHYRFVDQTLLGPLETHIDAARERIARVGERLLAVPTTTPARRR